MYKIIIVISTIVVLALGEAPLVHAQELTTAQTQQIKQSCHDAQVNLRGVQQRDTVLRINRGRLYDQVLKQTGAFVARLGVNKITAPDINKDDSNLRSNVQYFKDDYDHYANDLDIAIAINCADKPQTFYDALQKAIHGRKAVATDVANIKQNMADYTSNIGKLDTTQFPQDK